jgi:small subunit ribosomal protein S20
MATISTRKPSALKRHRQEEKKQARNKAVKTQLKTMIKKVRESALNQTEKTEELLKATVKKIDKAADKGIIHKNTAARKKARLMRFINKYAASPETQANK